MDIKNNSFNDISNLLNSFFNLIIQSNIDIYISSIKKINTQYINNFYTDTEHGFFHGLMATFVMYLIHLDSNNTNQLTDIDYSSTILHDFLKSNGYQQELHDKELIYFFDKLVPETYQHSNPSDKYKNNLLIKADRIELRRYDDYKEWVDERFYNLVSSLSKKTQDYVDIFYNNIRPALLYLYTNRNKEFNYHIELANKTTIYGIDTYPFVNSLQKYGNNNCKIYSIEPDSTDNIIYVINNINKSLLDNTLIGKKLIQQTNISSFHNTTHFLMNKFLCLNS